MSQSTKIDATGVTNGPGGASFLALSWAEESKNGLRFEIRPTVCLGSAKYFSLGQRLKYVNPLQMT